MILKIYNKYVMYKYINWSIAKCYINKTREFLLLIQKELKEEHKIHLQIGCIGSSKRKLITKNNDEPFDSDWDFQISKCPIEFINKPKMLKDLIRNTIDKNKANDWSFSKDSKSVITCFYVDMEYSFDIAILGKINGEYQKLVNDKISSNYIWNKQPEFDFATLNMYVKSIKRSGLWLKFKDAYLEHKNEELSSKTLKTSSAIYRQTVHEFSRIVNIK